ncbi:MAG TPA: protein-methionine-sulfoxide reductase heme-binding subunit MsrQ [Burkholderiaceae bacterium]|nr:protein-methionine-sulfoxide reductase heme-binding subunit MsrQ [Burkholderiaceae bacterium]HQR76227.1 protein-methionine-sulfoxide reductase heme-binding subunit MsrQ [Burkholderiaceae bacterium]
MGGAATALGWIPPNLTPRVLRVVRGSVFLLALLPLAHLLLRGVSGALGANPVEAILRSLGTWTLVLLLVTLSITPLRRLTGWSWLLRLRRMLGLFAFFYAVLHVTAFVWLDHWFEWTDILADVAKRPYLTFGFVAFVLMIPLAATSTNAMVRRLGGRNWQRLHRLVYLIGVLGVLHYWFHKLAKNDLAEPVIYAAVLGVLFVVRLWHWRAGRRAAAPVASAARRS